MVKKDRIIKAIEETKKAPKKGFVQTIDLVVNLKNLDMSKPENRIDQEIVLPGGRGKDVRIALFAEGELAHQSKGLVDTVIGKNRIESLAKNKKKSKDLAKRHNFFLAQTDMMALIGKTLGPVLGPRGKMPKPIPPNVDIKPIVSRLRKTVKVRTRDRLTFHLPVGTEEMKSADLADNIYTVLDNLETKLGKGSHNIGNVYLKKTMGESVRLEVS